MPQLELHKESEDEDAKRNEDELKEKDPERKDDMHVAKEAKDEMTGKGGMHEPCNDDNEPWNDDDDWEGPEMEV